ncbi:hypothetical protein [Clostridium rectalis]|nr:hypothetical protein [Clostridium rectalis]
MESEKSKNPSNVENNNINHKKQIKKDNSFSSIEFCIKIYDYTIF